MLGEFLSSVYELAIQASSMAGIHFSSMENPSLETTAAITAFIRQTPRGDDAGQRRMRKIRRVRRRGGEEEEEKKKKDLR